MANNFYDLIHGANNRKRDLGIRDRQILFMAAKGRCQNPYCKKKLASEREMQPGHKTAFSRGGRTTIKNSVCLCYACNKLQGTDSWEKFLKKQAIANGQAKPREKKVVVKKRRRVQSDLFGSKPFKINPLKL